MAGMLLHEAVAVACAAMEYKRSEHDDDLRRVEYAVRRSKQPEYRDEYGPAEVKRLRGLIGEIDEAMALLRKAGG